MDDSDLAALTAEKLQSGQPDDVWVDGMSALVGQATLSVEQFEAAWRAHLARGAVFTPVNIESLVWLALEYYRQPGNETGGHLHVVLDDGSVEASSLVWCYAQAVKAKDMAGAALALGLLDLSVTERDHFVRSHYPFYSS